MVIIKKRPAELADRGQLFSGFPFFGDSRAPGAFLADSPENFSTERPVFVASPAPLGPENLVRQIFCSTFGEFQGADSCLVND